jgi:hypothetical protein
LGGAALERRDINDGYGSVGEDYATKQSRYEAPEPLQPEIDWFACLAREQGSPTALTFGWAHRAVADRMPSHGWLA